MEKMKIGVLGTSDIAFRRFLPALQKSSFFEYVGVASRSVSKTRKFVEAFGGNGYDGYDTMINDPTIGAVYIPLPPALHFEYAKKALEHGKHVLLEKPFTTTGAHSKILIQLAKNFGLALHENYMFLYHTQIQHILDLLQNSAIGDVRLYRIAFGFPKLDVKNFRYQKALGGGALLDCGGYPVRLSAKLLGNSVRVASAQLCGWSQYGVDLYGSATLVNDKNEVAQIAFGMDNEYRCELDVWGSKGNLTATRIFTAGIEVQPEVLLKQAGNQQQIKLDVCNQFLNSIDEFEKCILDSDIRNNHYEDIATQARLIDSVFSKGEK